MVDALQFCVFSFNRGRFLEHCVRSIERCAPTAAVHIYDDASDDPDTLAALARLRARHSVVVRPGGRQSKHGGLSANMQAALEQVDGRLCFLQDDMQLVRPLDDGDYRGIEAFFGEQPDAGFLHPAFFKGCNRDRDQRITRFDAATGTYFRDGEGMSVGHHYSDIFIAEAARLRAVGWRFTARERGNEPQAQQHFRPMGFLFAPFVMWLPRVPAYRGRTKTWAMARAERRQGSGFHPIADMMAADVQALKARAPEVLPVAEDFLRAGSPPIPAPWHYYPLQKAPLLKALDRLERRWRG